MVFINPGDNNNIGMLAEYLIQTNVTGEPDSDSEKKKHFPILVDQNDILIVQYFMLNLIIFKLFIENFGFSLLYLQ